ncbi:hypothetical protein FOPE_02412 [Fonsecaea pedrosoi]|nr:hypothetical protein FOPE_02412 [Fonsecaea pedrosoi]
MASVNLNLVVFSSMGAKGKGSRKKEKTRNFLMDEKGNSNGSVRWTSVLCTEAPRSYSMVVGEHRVLRLLENASGMIMYRVGRSRYVWAFVALLGGNPMCIAGSGGTQVALAVLMTKR